MPNEFQHFRMCAKYWKRLSKFADEEFTVLKILKIKHVDCWLRLLDMHILKLFKVNS